MLSCNYVILLKIKKIILYERMNDESTVYKINLQFICSEINTFTSTGTLAVHDMTNTDTTTR